MKPNGTREPSQRVAPSVSVIIPNFNGGDQLAASVASVFKQGFDEPMETVVVDNGSNDDSVSKIQLIQPSVRIIANAQNMGFGAACNRGAGAATGRFLLFLNNDATLAEDALNRLVAAAESDHLAAVWQPCILGPDGRTTESYGIAFSWTGFFTNLRRPPPEIGGKRSIFAAVGACMLVRRDVFESVGGFREFYFAYVEDVDFCWRARIAGWEVRSVPEARANHIGGVTTRRTLGEQAYFLGFRNRLYTILVNTKSMVLLLILPIHVFACLGVSLILATRGRMVHAASILRALMWSLSNWQELRVERESVQKYRKLSDRVVLRKELRQSVPFGEWRERLRDNAARW